MCDVCVYVGVCILHALADLTCASLQHRLTWIWPVLVGVSAPVAMCDRTEESTEVVGLYVRMVSWGNAYRGDGCIVGSIGGARGERMSASAAARWSRKKGLEAGVSTVCTYENLHEKKLHTAASRYAALQQDALRSCAAKMKMLSRDVHMRTQDIHACTPDTHADTWIHPMAHLQLGPWLQDTRPWLQDTRTSHLQWAGWCEGRLWRLDAWRGWWIGKYV